MTHSNAFGHVEAGWQAAHLGDEVGHSLWAVLWAAWLTQAAAHRHLPARIGPGNSESGFSPQQQLPSDIPLVWAAHMDMATRCMTHATVSMQT